MARILVIDNHDFVIGEHGVVDGGGPRLCVVALRKLLLLLWLNAEGQTHFLLFLTVQLVHVESTSRRYSVGH